MPTDDDDDDDGDVDDLNHKVKPEYPAHLPCRPALESQTSPCAASPAGKTTSIVVSHLVLGLG